MWMGLYEVVKPIDDLFDYCKYKVSDPYEWLRIIYGCCFYQAPYEAPIISKMIQSFALPRFHFNCSKSC